MISAEALTERVELKSAVESVPNEILKQTLISALDVIYQIPASCWPIPASDETGVGSIAGIIERAGGKPLKPKQLEVITSQVKPETIIEMEEKPAPFFNEEGALLCTALAQTTATLMEINDNPQPFQIAAKTATMLGRGNPLNFHFEDEPQGDFEALKPKGRETYLEEINSIKSSETLRQFLLHILDLIPDDPLTLGELAALMVRVCADQQNIKKKPTTKYIGDTLHQNISLRLGVGIEVGNRVSILYPKSHALALGVLLAERGGNKDGTNMNESFSSIAKRSIAENHPWSYFIDSKDNHPKKDFTTDATTKQDLEKIKLINLAHLETMRNVLAGLVKSEPTDEVSISRLQSKGADIPKDTLVATISMLSRIFKLNQLEKGRKVIWMDDNYSSDNSVTNKQLYALVDDIYRKCKKKNITDGTLYQVYVYIEKKYASAHQVSISDFTQTRKKSKT